MSTLPSQWYETPDLAGDHVRLVQLHSHHAPAVLAAADDDEVFRWLRTPRPTTEAEAEAMVAQYQAMPDAIAWAQVDQQHHDVVGLTTYYDINAEQRTVAIGSTWLAKRAWRTGINTEAKLLLLSRAFDDLGCVRVVWHTDMLNERSQQAIERLGAQREGVLRKHKRRRDGSWRDTVVYSMTDDEWPAARDALTARLRQPRTSD